MKFEDFKAVANKEFLEGLTYCIDFRKKHSPIPENIAKIYEHIKNVAHNGELKK